MHQDLSTSFRKKSLNLGLTHNFIRLGLTRAQALQTVSQFPRETRRRYAAPKSNTFTLQGLTGFVDTMSILKYMYMHGY